MIDMSDCDTGLEAQCFRESFLTERSVGDKEVGKANLSGHILERVIDLLTGSISVVDQNFFQIATMIVARHLDLDTHAQFFATPASLA